MSSNVSIPPKKGQKNLLHLWLAKFFQCPSFSHFSHFLLFLEFHITDYGRPRKPNWKNRTNKIWGIFGRTIFGTFIPLSKTSIILLFLPQNTVFRPNQKMFWGNSHHGSVVGAPYYLKFPGGLTTENMNFFPPAQKAYPSVRVCNKVYHRSYAGLYILISHWFSFDLLLIDFKDLELNIFDQNSNKDNMMSLLKLRLWK